jgi:hypothetical protein
LINGEHKVLVTDVVLTETVWLLKGKQYGELKNIDIITFYTFNKAALEISSRSEP